MKKAVAAARYNAGFAVLALAQVGVSMGLSTVLGALTGRVSTAGLAPGVLALAAGSAGLYALAAAGD